MVIVCWLTETTPDMPATQPVVALVTGAVQPAGMVMIRKPLSRPPAAAV